MNCRQHEGPQTGLQVTAFTDLAVCCIITEIVMKKDAVLNTEICQSKGIHSHSLMTV